MLKSHKGEEEESGQEMKSRGDSILVPALPEASCISLTSLKPHS